MTRRRLDIAIAFLALSAGLLAGVATSAWNRPSVIPENSPDRSRRAAIPPPAPPPDRWATLGFSAPLPLRVARVPLDETAERLHFSLDAPAREASGYFEISQALKPLAERDWVLVEFRARADEARLMRVLLRPDRPQSEPLAPIAVLPIQTGWHRHRALWCVAYSDGHPRLELALESLSGWVELEQVELRNVTLWAAAIAPLQSPQGLLDTSLQPPLAVDHSRWANLVKPSAEGEGWNAWSFRTLDKVDLERQIAPHNPGRLRVIARTMPLQPDYPVELASRVEPLTAGETLLLEFRARANPPRKLRPLLGSTMPGAQPDLVPGVELAVNENWCTYRIIWNVRRDEYFGQLMLGVGQRPGAFEVDDMHLIDARLVAPWVPLPKLAPGEAWSSQPAVISLPTNPAPQSRVPEGHRP